MNRILKAQQLADAALHHRPRGNLSDLYPRWLGARELLSNRRNPYSTEVTREIQQGYYGRPLDSTRSEDPKDQQGFAYPVYVVFLFAPTIHLPFEEVQFAFRWLLILLAPVTILLWLGLLAWRPRSLTALTLAILSIGWLPMVQGIKLQQLSLLVAALLALCAACLPNGWLLLAGAILALATIKPQLAWPLIVWLLVWVAADWRSRWRLVLGFALVMALLLVGAEWILPGWIPLFVAAIAQYHRYTQNQSVLVWMFGALLGRVLEVGAFLACGVCVWPLRRGPAGSPEFGRATALVLALTVLIVPMFAPYNQVLLAPAILALVKRATSSDPILPAIRRAAGVGGLLLVWPWIATVLLTVGYPWLTPQLRQHVWPMPFYSNFLLPIFVFGLALLELWMVPGCVLRDRAAAE
jgi:hypothetical protein